MKPRKPARRTIAAAERRGGVSEVASEITSCAHVHARKVVSGAPASWCTECGAIYDGQTHMRPALHAKLRAAQRR